MCPFFNSGIKDGWARGKVFPSSGFETAHCFHWLVSLLFYELEHGVLSAGLSPDHMAEPASGLILDFPVCRTARNKCVFFPNYPLTGVLLTPV